MSLVVDSSIALAWYFEDEITDASDDVLRLVSLEGAIAPSLWRFEVANALQVAVRRKRITADYRDRVFARLTQLNVAADPDGDLNAWSSTVRLSDRHSLTIYDAAYLELALRRRLALASLDKALLQAARSEHVRVLGI